MSYIATIFLILSSLALPFACQLGLERQYKWDIAYAEDQCGNGYMQYCKQLMELRKNHAS